jgi:enoyl-CoA hydratase
MDAITIETHAADNGGAVAVVTLNDPERRNTLSAEMVRMIVDAFDQFEAAGSNVGAVVVTGSGKAFCAGADLGQLGAHGSEDEASRGVGLRSIYDGFLRVARSTLPTVAAVNGPAVGAGMNLALCCDVRLAGQSARFDTRFVQLGLHPGGGHMWMLTRAVGPQTAAAMVLFSEVLSADEARRQGLVHDVTEDSELRDRAIAFAAKAASNPRALVQRAKREVMLPPDEHARAVDREIEAQMWSMKQPFFAERLEQLKRRIAKKS